MTLKKIKIIIHFSAQFRHGHNKNTHLSSAFLAIGGTVKYHLHKHLLCTISFNSQVEHLQGNVAKVVFLSASSNRTEITSCSCFIPCFKLLKTIFMTVKNSKEICS